MKSLNCSGDIAQALFEFLGKRNIGYAVLGNISNFPEIRTDLDICVESYREFFGALKEFCISNEVVIINVRRHATGIRFDLGAISNNGGFIVLPGPDICLFPVWRTRGNIGFSFSKLLESHIISSFGFPIPAAEDAFIYYSIKRIDKGILTAAAGEYLADLWRQSPSRIRKKLAKRWPKKLGDLLIEAAEKNSWADVTAAVPDFQRELQRRSTWDPERTIWAFKRIPSRIAFPTGLHVAFLGPDGSGKTSVISGVSPSLAKVFSGVSYHHLRPGIGRTRGGGPVVDPHGQPARGLLSSTAKAIYLWFDYCFGWWATVWPKRARSTAVIFDRYYHDMLVDTKRYRYGGSTWLAQLVGALIPKPDLWVLLDAPTEVLQSRKQEVSFDETARQRDAYLELVKGMRNSVVINSNQPLEKVVSDVEIAIFGYLVARTRRRLG